MCCQINFKVQCCLSIVKVRSDFPIAATIDKINGKNK